MIFQYINTKNIYPFDRHLIDGLKEIGHDVKEIEISGSRFGKYFSLIKVLVKNDSPDAEIFGYSSPHLAIVGTLVCRIKGKKNIFNAVHSQYEANITSRNFSKFGVKALKFWLIDFLSFNLSQKVLLESNAQIEYIKKLTMASKRKLFRSWSGVNEKDFFINTNAKKLPDFTVLFRGRFLPESGIETVIKAAHILDGTGIKFRIIGHGHLHIEYNQIMKILRPKNIEELTKTLPIDTLREKMQECHLSLGQLAINERLDRTLPCKLFESLALSLPYLTGRNKGVLELLTEDLNCICVEPGNPEELAKKIILLRDNPQKLEKIAKNGYNLYLKELTSKHLAEDFVRMFF